jgi:hypothetical protein
MERVRETLCRITYFCSAQRSTRTPSKWSAPIGGRVDYLVVQLRDKRRPATDRVGPLPTHHATGTSLGVIEDPSCGTKITSSYSDVRSAIALMLPSLSSIGANGRVDYSVWIVVPRLLIIASNSRLVAVLSRNAPNIRLVTMVTPGLWTPRVVMH